MPRTAKLPDLASIDITELQLVILAILDERGLGPEFWQCLNGGAQIGALLDHCGGAREVLHEAIRRLRQFRSQGRRPCAPLQPPP
jgi:hypothetical protein